MILRIKEVLSKVGLSRATIWRRVKAGDFPAPLRLGGPNTRAVGWDSAAIDQWIASLPPVGNESSPQKEVQPAGSPAKRHGNKKHSVRLPKRRNSVARRKKKRSPVSNKALQCPGSSTGQTCSQSPGEYFCPQVIQPSCIDLPGPGDGAQRRLEYKPYCNAYALSANTCNISVN